MVMAVWVSHNLGCLQTQWVPNWKPRNSQEEWAAGSLMPQIPVAVALQREK